MHPTFQPDTAGTMAQILAILLLAVAFDPTHRGGLAPYLIRTRNRVRITTRGGWFASYRLISVLVTALVIFGDALCFMLGHPAPGALYVLLLWSNSLALGLIAGQVLIAVVLHAVTNRDSRQRAARQEPDSEATDDDPLR